MSVTAALSALSVFGNVLGEERDSDWWVDASDVDTDISSRRNMYNIYSYSYLLVCLSDAGSSSPHACSTSLSRAGMWEVTPNSLTFSSSWTKFLCLFFFVFRQLRAGRGPCFQFFRARFARVAVEGNTSPSSSDEPVSADLRM